jgi:hypothetical protein
MPASGLSIAETIQYGPGNPCPPTIGGNAGLAGIRSSYAYLSNGDGQPIALPRLLSYLSNLASLAAGPAETPL